GGGEEGDDPPVTDWRGTQTRCASYARFMRERVWDRLTGPAALALLFAPDEPAFGPAPLDFLTEHFREVPREGVPPEQTRGRGKGARTWQFRFYRPAARVHVTAVGDPWTGECKACWKLAADSEPGLVALLNQLRGFLSTRARCSPNGPAARAAVEALRKEHRKPNLWRLEGRDKP